MRLRNEVPSPLIAFVEQIGGDSQDQTSPLFSNPPAKQMKKPHEEKPLTIRCPNCKQVREPDFNETTRRYVCPLCAAPVDAQVLIEKKKRGLR